jgi:hypothetical protein
MASHLDIAERMREELEGILGEAYGFETCRARRTFP